MQDWLPTLVEAAGGAVEMEYKLPLDGVSQWQMLSKGAPSARTDLLINIERDAPTTTINPSVLPPPSPSGKALLIYQALAYSTDLLFPARAGAAVQGSDDLIERHSWHVLETTAKSNACQAPAGCGWLRSVWP